MSSPRSGDPIFLKSEYGRIADLISFVALIAAVTYIGIQPLASPRHQLPQKPTNSSWFAQRPASSVIHSSQASIAPKSTQAPKVQSKVSPEAKLEKAMLFSAFESILATYKAPEAAPASKEAPIPSKPASPPVNSETLSLFAALKSILADQSGPGEQLSLDMFAIIKKFLADPEIRKTESRSKSSTATTLKAASTSTKVSSKASVQTPAPKSVAPGEYQSILSFLQGLLADPNQRSQLSGKPLDSSSLLSGAKSFLADQATPEAGKKPEEPAPQPPKKEEPKKEKDATSEVLAALKALLDEYHAKIKAYEARPKEEAPVREQPAVVREKPATAKKPSQPQSPTGSSWSFLKNFLADSQDTLEPLGYDQYGVIYNYLKGFLAESQPSKGQAPPASPRPTQKSAPPKQKASPPLQSFDFFSSIKNFLADQNAPVRPPPQDPINFGGSLAEFFQSLLADPAARKEKPAPTVEWNFGNWRNILANPQAQKKPSPNAKVFENIYKSNSMKTITEAFKSLLAGSEPSQPTTDLSSFKALFASLLACNDFDEAKTSFRKLVKESVNPDIDTTLKEEPVKEFFTEWASTSEGASWHILDFLKSLLADQNGADSTADGKLWDAVFTEPIMSYQQDSSSPYGSPQPQAPVTCLKGFKGVDSTWDSFCSSNCPKGKCPVSLCQCDTSDEKLICKDNRYTTLPGKKFLCQASCNVAPFNCPKTECGCKNPGMETTQRCTSPFVCKSAKYSAIPGTIATNQWCQSQCTDQTDSRYCPCTLCECSDACGQTVENGDFEQGLKGWNVVRQSGSLGLVTTVQAGSVAPVSSKPVTPLGKQGNKIAYFDSASAGSYVLYQEISPKAGDTLFVSWTVSNYKPFSNRPESLAANVKGNQQFRIDIVKPDSTEWFNTQNGNKDVLANVLSPTRVGAVVSALGKPPYSDSNAWRNLRYDLDAFAGQKVLLAFRVVNNAGIMNVGIDDVRIQNVACGLDKPTFAKSTKPVKMEEQGPACGAPCQNAF